MTHTPLATAPIVARMAWSLATLQGRDAEPLPDAARWRALHPEAACALDLAGPGAPPRVLPFRPSQTLPEPIATGR